MDQLDDSTSPITLCPPGYKIISVPRDDRVGGGVALVHREEIPVTHNVTYSYESMECSDFNVSLSSFNLNLAVIYQPPNKSSCISDQISICIGTVTTQFLPSIVWLEHSITGQRPYALATSCYSKKKNIFQKN